MFWSEMCPDQDWMKCILKTNIKQYVLSTHVKVKHLNMAQKMIEILINFTLMTIQILKKLKQIF